MPCEPSAPNRMILLSYLPLEMELFAPNPVLQLQQYILADQGPKKALQIHFT
jgi:hypothetical protein